MRSSTRSISGLLRRARPALIRRFGSILLDRDNRTIADALTEGAQSHTALTAVAFAAMTIGALTGWSRLCEAEKNRARARAHARKA
jgi:hypothetical protein